jgi:hypothetical protein
MISPLVSTIMRFARICKSVWRCLCPRPCKSCGHSCQWDQGSRRGEQNQENDYSCRATENPGRSGFGTTSIDLSPTEMIRFRTIYNKVRQISIAGSSNHEQSGPQGNIMVVPF